LRVHHLQPTYELFLRRKVPAVFADMWIASSFVLEAIPGWDKALADTKEEANETDTPESVDGNVAKEPERWTIPDFREAAEQEILPSPD